MGNACGRHDSVDNNGKQHHGDHGDHGRTHATGTQGAAAAHHGPRQGALVAKAQGIGIQDGRHNDPEWLTTLLRHMWPYLSSTIQKQVWAMLPDMLQQSKPKWITTLDLQKFDLGTACPLVNNVIAGQGPDPGAEDVFLEMDVQWVAKGSDVELKVNPLPTFITKIPGLKSLTSFTVGVEDIAVRARVRVTMIPMLNDVPLVGALQVALLEDPLIDFELTVGQGSGGGAGLLDLLEPWLRNFVTDTISSSYVLPGHYFYPLAQGIPDIQTAHGLLEVVVIEAESVPKMDYLTNSSPYCKLWLSGAKKHTKQTEVVDYTKNPKWTKDTHHGFVVHVPDHQKLVLSLYDSDYGGDDEIGRTTLPLKDLPAGRTRDMWLGFVEDEQDAMPGGGPKTAGHNAGVYQGTADGHDKEHRSLVDKAMKAINPGPNQANQHLKECKLHVQVTYFPLSSADIRSLNIAMAKKQNPPADFLQQPVLKQLVQRYNLNDQLRPQPTAAAAPASGPASNTATAVKPRENEGGNTRGNMTDSPQGVATH
eukprot:jgi/Chrzof1/5376/Cz16g00170.t1